MKRDLSPLGKIDIRNFFSPSIPQPTASGIETTASFINQDFDDFDDFEDDEDVHSFELRDSNSDSEEETEEICIYKLRRLACPVRLKKLEDASKQCVENLMEDGNVTNPKSENYKL